MNTLGSISTNFSHLSSTAVTVSRTYHIKECSYFFIAYSSYCTVVVKAYIYHTNNLDTLTSKLIHIIPFKTDKKAVNISKSDTPFLYICSCDGFQVYEITLDELFIVYKNADLSILPLSIYSAVNEDNIPICMLIMPDSSLKIYNQNDKVQKVASFNISIKNIATISCSDLSNGVFFFVIGSSSGRLVLYSYSLVNSAYEKHQDFRPFEKKISSLQFYKLDKESYLLATSLDKTVKTFFLNKNTLTLKSTFKIPNKQSRRGKYPNDQPNICIDVIVKSLNAHVIYSFDGSMYYLQLSDEGRELNYPIDFSINQRYLHSSIFAIGTSKSSETDGFLITFGFDNRINFHRLDFSEVGLSLKLLLSSRMLPFGKSCMAVSPHSRSESVQTAIGTGDGSISVVRLSLENDSKYAAKSCQCKNDYTFSDQSNQDNISIFYPNGKKSSPIVALAWHPNIKTNSIIGYATLTGVVNSISIVNEENSNRSENHLKGNGSHVYRIAWGPAWPLGIDKAEITPQDWMNMPYMLYSVSNYKLFCQKKKNQPSHVVIDPKKDSHLSTDHLYNSICDLDFKWNVTQNEHEVLMVTCDDKGDVAISSVTLAYGILVLCCIPTGVFNPNAMIVRYDAPQETMVVAISNSKISLAQVKLEFLAKIISDYKDQTNEKAANKINFDKYQCVIHPNIITLEGVKNRIFDMDWNIDDPLYLVTASFDQTVTVWRTSYNNDNLLTYEDISNYRDMNQKAKFSRWCSTNHVVALSDAGFLHIFDYAKQDNKKSLNSRKCRPVIKPSKYFDEASTLLTPDGDEKMNELPNKSESLRADQASVISTVNEEEKLNSKKKVSVLLPMEGFNPAETDVLDDYLNLSIPSSYRSIVELIKLNDNQDFPVNDVSLHAWISTRKSIKIFKQWTLSQMLKTKSSDGSLHPENIDFNIGNVILLLWLGKVHLVFELMKLHSYNPYWLMLCMQASSSYSLKLTNQPESATPESSILNGVIDLKLCEIRNEHSPREIDVLITATILVCAGRTEEAVSLLISKTDRDRVIYKNQINAIFLIRCRLAPDHQLFKETVSVLIQQAETLKRYNRIALLSVIHGDYSPFLNLFKNTKETLPRSLIKAYCLFLFSIDNELTVHHTFSNEELVAIRVNFTKLLLMNEFLRAVNLSNFNSSLLLIIDGLERLRVKSKSFVNFDDIFVILKRTRQITTEEDVLENQMDESFLKAMMEKRYNFSDFGPMQEGIVNSLLYLMSSEASQLQSDQISTYKKSIFEYFDKK